MSYDGGTATSEGPRDSDLTNLSWVAGAPVPIQRPVSPTRKGAASRSKPLTRDESRISLSGSGKSLKGGASPRPSQTWEKKTCHSIPVHEKHTPYKRKGETPKKEPKKEEREGGGGWGDRRRKKPNCSYTSLIGLALMASERSCLPVSEIYTYIEEEFPYFKDAPEGWKNSIRHNLSLNPSFRKVQHPITWQGKKGFFWEVNPERRAGVEREVERYLRQEGKISDPHFSECAAPFPSCLHASIPSMPEQPSAMPSNWFQFYHGTLPYYDITASIHHHHYYHTVPRPLPPAVPPPPASCGNSASTVLSSLLDTSQLPSQFAGYPNPSAETQSTSALLDLFGLQLPSQHSHCSVHTHAATVSPSESAPVLGMCTLYGESAATGLGQEEELNCDCAGTLSDMAELSLPMDQSPSPPGSTEAKELVLESSSTHSDSLLDSELPSSCIQLRDWCDRMDCSKACAGEFSLLLSLGGDMEDGIFESMSEGEEGGAAEPDSALDSGGSRSGSERVTEEQSSVLVDTASGDVGCCLETSDPLPQPSAAVEGDHVRGPQRGNVKGKGKRRKRVKRRGRKCHKNTSQSNGRDVPARLGVRDGGEEGGGGGGGGGEGGGGEVGDSKGGDSNMLSSVCADSEETMRDLLLLSCTPYQPRPSGCDQATIEDGLFSPPQL